MLVSDKCRTCSMLVTMYAAPGEADAGGGVHCFQHIGEKPADSAVHPLDRRGLALQAWVGRDDYWEEGHGQALPFSSSSLPR